MKRIIMTGGTALALLAPSAGVAGTSSGVMPVSATVLESCTVAATPLLFGIVSPGSAAIDSSATISLVCTPNADYDISLNGGGNASSGQRRMRNLLAGEYIPYDLYMDSNRSQPWGNSLGTDTKSGTASILGLASYPVYGRIPASASPVSAGAYSDTVTVTVHF